MSAARMSTGLAQGSGISPRDLTVACGQSAPSGEGAGSERPAGGPHSATEPDRISNVPLREAFRRSGLTLTEVCFRLGWMKGSGSPQTSRLTRNLGLARNVSGGSSWRGMTSTMGLGRGIEIARALDVDFDVLYPDLPASVVACVCRLCDAEMLKADPEGMCGLCRLEIDSFGVAA